MSKILNTIWLIATIAIPVMGILGGIFGWFGLPWFLTVFFLDVGLSIVLGFITGHLALPSFKR